MPIQDEEIKWLIERVRLELKPTIDRYSLMIFDLDGTLMPNRSTSVAATNFQLLPGVHTICSILRENSILLGISSNQSARRDIDSIKEHMQWVCSRLKIPIYHALFEQDKSRKKPSPYMLNKIMARTRQVPINTLFVGDSESDRLAARAAGCSFFWSSVFFR